MKHFYKLIIDNQYFPNINWYNYSFKSKYILLCEYENFKKMSFRNRSVVAGSNGLINLSIPLQRGRDQKLAYRDVRINYGQNWQLNHWRTIASCYSKAPFFHFYSHELQSFFQKRHEFLFEFNLSILHWLNSVLRHPAEIKVIGAMDHVDQFSGSIDLRDNWLPKNFQAGDNQIRYAQVFEDRIGFQPNLSVLDLLFNTGPMATQILQNAEVDKNFLDH